MKKYDVVVIGSGAGMEIVEEALAHELKVAVVDQGPLGGTCPNVGCIPSKMIIFPADRIAEIQEAAKLGIEAEVRWVDFAAIMKRMKDDVRHNQSAMREGMSHARGLDLYEGRGHFTGDHAIEVNGETIRGERIFIAAGARPAIPPIPGLDTVDYLTNESALDLTARPESMIIIGGGYIAVEFGHFFAAMGTRVTVLEMADRLVLSEEPEVSALLEQSLSRRMAVHTGSRAEQVRRSDDGLVSVSVSHGQGQREHTAATVLVAVGRRSNADLLKVENTGVETDDRGFIKVNELLETTREGIYAVGDVNGRHMFRHMANVEAAIAADNALHGSGSKVDYSAVPHAVYSHPQIASVGLTEEQARAEHDILVGVARYSDVAKGVAMMETEGFAKAIVDREEGKILGLHIIGPYAPVLIQEVVNAMTSGGHIDEVGGGIHIHPSLSELIPAAFARLEEP